MARSTFGGGAADFVFTSTAAGLLKTAAASLTFWDAETGGTQLTDLRLNGLTVSVIPVGKDGQIPTFEGPDGVAAMWADAGAGRVRVSSDALGNIDTALDAALPAKISTPGNPVHEELRATIALETVPIVKEQRRFASGLYLPTEHALRRWRAARSRVIAGERQGHVAILGDSIPYGAGGGAVTAPKPQNNWPGRLRKAVTARYGDAGSGIVFAEINKRANPTWDPRWAFGTTAVDHAFGLYKAAAYRIDSVAGQYIEFTDKADTFVVYNYGNAGLNTAKVDGVTIGTFRNQGGTGGAASSIPKQTGYWTSQIVTEIAAGTYGTHTLRIEPDTSVATNDAFIGAIEARRTVNGTFRITEAARSGMSFADLFSRTNYNDEVNGLYGLPMIDMMRADVLVIALGINDWNGGRTLASTKADLKATIQRQRATTASTATIGKAAAGDVLLVWNPQPDLTTLGLTAAAPWADFRSMFYDVADEENCALLDLGERWTNYATGQSLGLFADGIHPNDAGSLDMAPAVERALFEYS